MKGWAEAPYMEQNGSGTLLYPLGLEQCLALSTCLINCTGWMNEETLNSSDRQRARGIGVNNQNRKLSNRDSRWTVVVTKTPQRKWRFKGARKYDENEALIPCGTARREHTKGVGCMQSISQVTWLLWHRPLTQSEILATQGEGQRQSLFLLHLFLRK